MFLKKSQMSLQITLLKLWKHHDLAPLQSPRSTSKIPMYANVTATKTCIIVWQTRPTAYELGLTGRTYYFSFSGTKHSWDWDKFIIAT